MPATEKSKCWGREGSQWKQPTSSRCKDSISSKTHHSQIKDWGWGESTEAHPCLPPIKGIETEQHQGSSRQWRLDQDYRVVLGSSCWQSKAAPRQPSLHFQGVWGGEGGEEADSFDI